MKVKHRSKSIEVCIEILVCLGLSFVGASIIPPVDFARLILRRVAGNECLEFADNKSRLFAGLVGSGMLEAKRRIRDGVARGRCGAIRWDPALTDGSARGSWRTT